MQVVLHFRQNLHAPVTLTHPIRLDTGSYESYYDLVVQEPSDALKNLVAQSVLQAHASQEQDAKPQEKKRRLSKHSREVSPVEVEPEQLYGVDVD